MRPLSASEAITPAIQRTKEFLFHPFKPGRTFKLAFTAYLTSLGKYFIPTPLISFLAAASQPHSNPLALLISLGFGTIACAFLLVFFYLGARIEFVLFDLVLLNEKFVAPSWRRHGHHSWRWVGLKLLFSLAVTILCGPLFYLAYRYFLPRMAATVPGQPPSPQLFANLGYFYLLIGLPIALVILLSSLLTNFVLPSIALENTTAREALRRALSLVDAEPGPVSVFVVFKILLGLAALIAMEAAIFLGIILGLIPIGLIAVIGWFALRSAGDAGHLLMLTGGILLCAIFAVFAFYIGTIATGCVYVFFQAYALYFLGGRYPLLGDMFEPPAPPATAFPQPQPDAAPPNFNPIPQPPPEPAV